MKNLLKYLIPIGLAVALMYLVFKGVDFNDVLTSFKSANYFLVFLAAIFSFLAHFSRALRWNLMMEPLGYHPSKKNTTIAVLIGYLTNLVLPRAGELARSASLQKSEKVPFEISFGAVIAERIIDLIVAIILLIINILLEFDRIKDLAIELFGEKLKNPTNLILIGLAGIGSVVLFFYLINKFKVQLQKNALVAKVFGIIEGLKSGFLGVLKIEKSGQFFLHTIFIWLMYYVATYCLCQSVGIGEHLSFLAILTILVMGSVGMAIPTMGGIGSYHLLVGKIVVLYGLSNQEGISLATFLHSMQGLLFVIVFGAIAFILSFLSSKKSI